MGLKGLTWEQIEFGFQRAMAECDELPAPAKVRKLALGNDSDTAAKAWEVAVKAVSAVGYVKGVNFQDATINATLRAMGGWPKFCNSFNREKEAFIKREFLETYQRWTTRTDEQTGRPLRGDGEHARIANIGVQVYSYPNLAEAVTKAPRLENEHPPRKPNLEAPKPETPGQKRRRENIERVNKEGHQKELTTIGNFLDLVQQKDGATE